MRKDPGKCSYRAMPWDFWVIFLILGVLIPWRGRVRLKRLLAQPQFDTREKLALYGSTIALQWILMGLVAWRAVARGVTLSDLALARKMNAQLLLVSLLGAAILASLQWLNLRRVARMSGPVPDLMRKLAARLLPGKTLEFPPYCALAVTAGVCEEFLYRGFAMAALNRIGTAVWAVLVITSILFGLAHAYQGRSGIVGTTLLGFLLGGCRLITHSLIPAMVWHAAVDVVAGIAGLTSLFRAKDQDVYIIT